MKHNMEINTQEMLQDTYEDNGEAGISLEPVQKGQIWKHLFCWKQSDDSGVGVVEVILILVVLIALVILFRDQLTSLVERLLRNVTSDALNF